MIKYQYRDAARAILKVKNVFAESEVFLKKIKSNRRMLTSVPKTLIKHPK